jgi:hypothetical protein
VACSNCLLSDNGREVKEVCGDVEPEGVGDVGEEAFQWALAGDEGLHNVCHERDHRKAAVLDLLELHFWGVQADGVEGELLHQA